jgi:hypothetical protein
MSTRRRLLKALAPLACAALVGIAVPAWADVGRDGAASIAQRMTGGRVLSVERAGGGREGAWRVKVVTGRGDVVVIVIDAASGRPL